METSLWPTGQHLNPSIITGLLHEPTALCSVAAVTQEHGSERVKRMSAKALWVMSSERPKAPKEEMLNVRLTLFYIRNQITLECTDGAQHMQLCSGYGRETGPIKGSMWGFSLSDCVPQGGCGERQRRSGCHKVGLVPATCTSLADDKAHLLQKEGQISK